MVHNQSACFIALLLIFFLPLDESGYIGLVLAVESFSKPYPRYLKYHHFLSHTEGRKPPNRSILREETAYIQCSQYWKLHFLPYQDYIKPLLINSSRSGIANSRACGCADGSQRRSKKCFQSSTNAVMTKGEAISIGNTRLACWAFHPFSISFI